MQTSMRSDVKLSTRFDLVLRDVQFERRQDVDDAFESLKTNGFINYFGMQRFGSGSTATQQTGVAILQENWKQAVNSILTPKHRDMRPKHGASHNEVMRLWQETQDAKKCWKVYWWKKSNEYVDCLRRMFI